jgi:hypothetical protein
MTPCRRVGNAIICTRERPRRCRYCGRSANLLCDFPLPGGKTCDAPICPSCSFPIGPNADYCKVHPKPEGYNGP